MILYFFEYPTSIGMKLNPKPAYTAEQIVDNAAKHILGTWNKVDVLTYKQKIELLKEYNYKIKKGII